MPPGAPEWSKKFVEQHYAPDFTMDTQNSPYDYCSLTHYNLAAKYGEVAHKVQKFMNIGCTPGQHWFRNAQPSVLDIQQINSKFQCGKPYEKLGTCSDYFK